MSSVCSEDVYEQGDHQIEFHNNNRCSLFTENRPCEIPFGCVAKPHLQADLICELLRGDDADRSGFHLEDSDVIAGCRQSSPSISGVATSGVSL